MADAVTISIAPLSAAALSLEQLATCELELATIAFRAFPTPAVSGFLHTITNANEAEQYYNDSRLDDVPWVTDLSRDLTLGSPFTGITIAQMLAFARTRWPGVMIGSYLSQGFLNDSNSSNLDPINRLPRSAFLDSELLAGVTDSDGPLVDFTSQSVRRKLLDLYAVEIAQRHADGYDAMYFDNCFYSYGPPYPSWDLQLDYLRALDGLTESFPLRMSINLALPFGDVTLAPETIAKLGGIVEGITLEEWALPAVVNSSNAVAALVDQYQALGDVGVRSIFLPNPADAIGSGTTDAKLEREAAFGAGVALQVGNAFVSLPFFEARPIPSWYTLPADLGRPTGQVIFSGMQISRQFQNGSVTSDFSTRTSTIS